MTADADTGEHYTARLAPGSFRYLKRGASRPLARLLADTLPGLGYAATIEFYDAFAADNPTLASIAMFGLNDRYFLLTGILGRKDALHPWLWERCREVEANTDGYLDLWARNHYKMLGISIPVATPTGWRNHGDLEPGDTVFAPDGTTTKVIARTEVWRDGECYEIEFDDGTRIRAGADHIWRVDRRSRRRIPGTYKVRGGKRRNRDTVLMTTREIAAHDHRPNRRLGVEMTAPLELPDAELPVDPYVLGAWLGDGTAANGQITGADEEIFAEIERGGYRLGKRQTKPGNKAWQVTVLGLVGDLRRAGVLGNKHIPAAYSRASASQRMALLHGLMDTDGHCDDRGTVTFVNTNPTLARQVAELAATLGMKPHLRQHTGTYLNAPYPFWHVSFQQFSDAPCFRLPRKAARAIKRSRTSRRYIVACRPIAPEPMSCIQVDRADGMYLAGRELIPTHNSTIITYAGIIQEVMRNPEITVGIFSHVRPKAKEFLRQIKNEFERNELLKAAYGDVLWPDPRRNAPKWSEDNGIVVKRHNNPKEATVEAHGLVDGMPTGSHFGLRVYDDVVTEKSVTTPEMVQKTSEARDLSNELGDRAGREWNIGTRYDFADTYQSMLDRKVVKPRIYPATDDGTADGNPVFLTPAEWANKRKKLLPSTMAAQQLMNPAAGSLSMFEMDWLRPWEVRPRTINVYILVDPAHRPNRRNRSDRTAMAVIGIDANWNHYLLDGFCHRMNLDMRWKNLRSLYRVWSRADGVQLCSVGYERFGLQSDIEHMQLEMEKNEGDSFPIEEVAWPQEGPVSKEDRVERLVPDFRNSKFFLPATVHHADIGGPCYWSIERPRNADGEEYGNPSIAWRETQGETKAMQAARNDGQAFRIARPIKRMDEEKQVYDLTQVFMEEFMYFPKSPRRDLLDAVSRVKDMSPRAPQFVQPESYLPPAFPDS